MTVGPMQLCKLEELGTNVQWLLCVVMLVLLRARVEGSQNLKNHGIGWLHRMSANTQQEV